MTPTTSSDRLTKQILLRAPRARVWQALTNAHQFGQWFRVHLDGQFSAGAHVRGNILHPGYEHVPFSITIEQMEPERLFAWRWHPNAVDPDADYSAEPTTLVVFELEDRDDGTLLTVAESGFDGIPLTRRLAAYRGNEQGWAGQMHAIEQYLAGGG